MTTVYEQLKAMVEACIDNTPQQVESLAKQVEWGGEGLPPVGVECEYYHAPRMTWVKFIPLLIVSKEDSPNGVFAMYGEWYHPVDCLWEADLIELEFGDVKFRKPESPQEKAKRERDEQAKLLLIDLCGDDVFKDRDWEYHKKFTHSAELAFRLIDKNWIKGE